MIPSSLKRLDDRVPPGGYNAAAGLIFFVSLVLIGLTIVRFMSYWNYMEKIQEARVLLERAEGEANQLGARAQEIEAMVSKTDPRFAGDRPVDELKGVFQNAIKMGGALTVTSITQQLAFGIIEDRVNVKLDNRPDVVMYITNSVNHLRQNKPRVWLTKMVFARVTPSQRQAVATGNRPGQGASVGPYAPLLARTNEVTSLGRGEWNLEITVRGSR
jgi:hypothetical protein